MLIGTLEIPGNFSTDVWAQDLEHMAEILTDTLPNDDPQQCFPVEVEGIGRIAFTCTGTYFELL